MVPPRRQRAAALVLDRGLAPLFVTPALLLLAVVVVGPFFYTLALSFTDLSYALPDHDGSFVVVNPQGLGLSGTLAIGVKADAVSSMRALLDRTLRLQVTAANLNAPALVRSNLDGTGHHFYVDPAAGFTYTQQADLVNFLLSLDDDPAQY